MAIDLGDIYPIAIYVRDEAGVLADTGAVMVSVTTPDGVTHSPVAATRTATGTYVLNYTTTQAGPHEWTAAVTGTIAGSHGDVFTVEDPAFGPLVSLAETKTYLGIDGTGDDEQLRFLALVASDACESPVGTGRAWRRRTVTDERHYGGVEAIQLLSTPVLAVLQVIESGVTLTSDSYVLDTIAGLLYRGTELVALTWFPGRLNVRVDYIAGAPSVPPLIRQGVLDMIQHLWMLPHHGADSMPRQEGYQWTPSMGYLIPNRVRTAWASVPTIGFA